MLRLSFACSLTRISKNVQVSTIANIRTLVYAIFLSRAIGYFYANRIIPRKAWQILLIPKLMYEPCSFYCCYMLRINEKNMNEKFQFLSVMNINAIVYYALSRLRACMGL
jgi:hypothetical protein